MVCIRAQKLLVVISTILTCLSLALARPSSLKADRYLYYLEERTVKRLPLPEGNPEEVFSFAVDLNVPNASAIRAAKGRLLWSDPGIPGALITWDGKRIGKISLPRHRMARIWMGYGFLWDEEERSSGDRKPDGIEGAALNLTDTWFTGYLLAPDGRRAAWNVNATVRGWKQGSGSFLQRHYIYSSGLNGKNIRQVFSADYVVKDVFADSSEHRRLRFWVPGLKESIYYTRYLGGQLSDLELGLFTCDLKTSVAKSLDDSLERVLAVSEDGRSAIWTPNDDSCCGGVNYTNNKVWLRDLNSGEDKILLDEWAEFENVTKEPGRKVSGGWADHYPTDALFSPRGTRVAILIEKWAEDIKQRPLPLTHVYTLGGEYKEIDLHDRSPVGWGNEDNLIVSRVVRETFPVSGGGFMKKWTVKEVFLYNLADGSETRLLGKSEQPITVGK